MLILLLVIFKITQKKISGKKREQLLHIKDMNRDGETLSK